MTNWAADTWQIASRVRWLAGPLFDKELRVASRRRMSYVVRFAYVGLLTLFVAIVWFLCADLDVLGSPASYALRMRAVGRYVSVVLIWFQYVGAQFLALALLGHAIGDEVRKGTLPVLAVTPMSAWQIVGGKLAGGLFPVLLLLATSLPLLTVVGVFGGVPWDYVVSGVGVTGATTVLSGVLSMLRSVRRGRSLAGILLGLWCCVLGRVPDVLLQCLAFFLPAAGMVGKPVLSLISPTNIVLARTQEMLAARPSTGSWWLLYSLILLAASGIALLLMSSRVRSVAARGGTERSRDGGAHRFARWINGKRSRSPGSLGQRAPVATAIRRVEGSPIVWKELYRSPMRIGGHPVRRCVRIVVTMSLLMAVLVGFFVVVVGAPWRSVVVPLAISWPAGLLIAMIAGSGMAAARAIAKEREARTLPVLLTTLLDDDRIIKDKAIAIVRGGAPVLVSLFVPPFFLLLVLNGFSGTVGWRVLLCGAGLGLVSSLGLVLFLLGLGLYCSVRFKTVAGANSCVSAVFLGLVLAVCSRLSFGRSIFFGGSQVRLTVVVWVILAAGLAAGLGWFLLRAASRRLRRHVF